MTPPNVRVHTRGDLIVVMAVSGQVRAYEVDADGALIELDSGVAIALRSARDTGDWGESR